MAMFGYGTLEQEIWDAIIESEQKPTYQELMLSIGKVLEAYAECDYGKEQESA